MSIARMLNRRRQIGRMAGAALLLAAVALATPGCGPRDTQGIGPVNGRTDPPPVPPATQMSTVSNNVNVTLSAGQITLPEILSSGWTNFIIRNDDRVAHMFGITGEGVDRMLPSEIQPGQSQQMRIELKPGTYRVFVPTGGPGMEGISRQIIVAKW